MKNRDEFERNVWEDGKDLQTVIDFIKKKANRSDGDWEWFRNGNCKYVQIRVDMRDGHFILLDRLAKRITFDELKFQCRANNENKRTN